MLHGSLHLSTMAARGTRLAAQRRQSAASRIISAFRNYAVHTCLAVLHRVVLSCTEVGACCNMFVPRCQHGAMCRHVLALCRDALLCWTCCLGSGSVGGGPSDLDSGRSFGCEPTLSLVQRVPRTAGTNGTTLPPLLEVGHTFAVCQSSMQASANSRLRHWERIMAASGTLRIGHTAASLPRRRPFRAK